VGETRGWEGIKPQPGPERAELPWTTPYGVGQHQGNADVGLRPRLLTFHRFAVSSRLVGLGRSPTRVVRHKCPYFPRPP